MMVSFSDVSKNKAHVSMGANGYSAGEATRNRGGQAGGGALGSGRRLGDAGPAQGVRSCRKAPGRGRVARGRRVQGAGAGIDRSAGKALEAQALGVPPLRLDGVAGAVAGGVEHGRGAWGAAARGGHGSGRRCRRGRRSRGSVLPVGTGVGCRGAGGPASSSDGGSSAAAPTGDDSAPFRTGGGGSAGAGRRGGALHLSPGKQVDKKGLVAGSDSLRSLTQQPLELIAGPGAADVGEALPSVRSP